MPELFDKKPSRMRRNFRLYIKYAHSSIMKFFKDIRHHFSHFSESNLSLMKHHLLLGNMNDVLLRGKIIKWINRYIDEKNHFEKEIALYSAIAYFYKRDLAKAEDCILEYERFEQSVQNIESNNEGDTNLQTESKDDAIANKNLSSMEEVRFMKEIIILHNRKKEESISRKDCEKGKCPIRNVISRMKSIFIENYSAEYIDVFPKYIPISFVAIRFNAISQDKTYTKKCAIFAGEMLKIVERAMASAFGKCDIEDNIQNCNKQSLEGEEILDSKCNAKESIADDDERLIKEGMEIDNEHGAKRNENLSSLLDENNSLSIGGGVIRRGAIGEGRMHKKTIIKQMSCLDIGSGFGFVGALLNQTGYVSDVTGIDIANEMTSIARKIYAGRDERDVAYKAVHRMSLLEYRDGMKNGIGNESKFDLLILDGVFSGDSRIRDIIEIANDLLSSKSMFVILFNALPFSSNDDRCEKKKDCDVECRNGEMDDDCAKVEVGAKHDIMMDANCMEYCYNPSYVEKIVREVVSGASVVQSEEIIAKVNRYYIRCSRSVQYCMVFKKS